MLPDGLKKLAGLLARIRAVKHGYFRGSFRSVSHTWPKSIITMDRDSINRRSRPSTSYSDVRINEEPVLPSQEREDAATGSDALFMPQAPVATFTLGNAPITSYSQNAAISSDPSSVDDNIRFNSSLNIPTGQDQTGGSSQSFNQPMQESISGMQQYAQSSAHHPHQNPAPIYISDFQDLFTGTNSAGGNGSEYTIDSVISGNQTTGALDTHYILTETGFGARLGNSNSHSQLLEPPGEPVGQSLTLATRDGSGLSSTPITSSSRDPHNQPLQESISGMQQYAQSSAYHPHQNPAPIYISDFQDPFTGTTNSAGGNGSEYAIDSVISGNQTTGALDTHYILTETGFGPGLGNSNSHSQLLEPPGEPVGQSLTLATRDGSGLNSTPTTSSSRDPHSVDAGVLYHANAILPYHGEVTVNLSHPNTDTSVGFRARTDNASSVSQSIYNPMIYNTAPLRAIQDMRQNAFSPLQPQNVNYGQQYLMANYRTSIFGGHADSSRNAPFQFQGHPVSPSVPLVNNQAGLLGFAQYAQPGLPSPFSMNFHGTAQTASHGMPRYPQIGWYSSASLSTMTSSPVLPGTTAVPRQNRPGQPHGSHQVQLHTNFSGCSSPDQLPPAVSRFGPSPSSHVRSSFRKRPAQDYLPANINENQRRTRPPPLQLVPPLVQSQASSPTQAQVSPSLSHFRQAAPASQIPPQTARPIHSSTQSIQQRLPMQGRSPRPLSARAQSYVPLAQRSTAPSMCQQHAAQKIPSRQHGAKVTSRRAIPPLALPHAPSSTERIRWKGEEHQLIGRNCYFCKRDLSYPPEGPIIENQQLLPTVSVLPCGHAFHDFCLQRITPPDKVDDPPCIPCAIGEEP